MKKVFLFAIVATFYCSFSSDAQQTSKGGQHDFKKGSKAMYALDFEKAEKYFLLAIEKGNTDAMAYLGDMYRAGNVGNVNYIKALQYLKPAADAGNSSALHSLFTIYTDSRQPFYNRDSALKVAAVSCQIASSKEAMYPAYVCASGAELLRHEREREKLADGSKGVNDDIIFLWAKKSALDGWVNGMEELSFCFQDGIGTEESKTAAIAWAKEAIAHGSDKCRYTLAQMTGTKPVFRDGDYRTIDANQKELAAHPERRLTKADLPGGYVSNAENDAFNSWWDRTYGKKSSIQTTSSTNNKLYQAPKSDPYESMHDSQRRAEEAAGSKNTFYKH